MARYIPTVSRGVLILTPNTAARPDGMEVQRIAVDSPAWREWLACHDTTRFQFKTEALHFTVRRTRRQGEVYWYATCRDRGNRRELALGTTAELTLRRLKDAADDLARLGTPKEVDVAVQPAPSARAQRRAGDHGHAAPQFPPGDQGVLATEDPNGSLHADAIANPPHPQLLATKLFIPPLRPNLVSRRRLVEQLEAGLRGPLTVLAAPAGWGKTTVLAEWYGVVERDQPVAWVSLDAGDNDPARFWTYVLSALNAARPGVAEDALRLLRMSQPPAIEAVVTLLMNALAALSTDIVLVLDDYQLISASVVHVSLTYLLEHMPPQFHLVVTSREDPPLPLARMRVGGALCELRAADLRFTTEEAGAFLAQSAGMLLPAEAVDALEARTEGWIAGLQLAALSVQGRSGEGASAFIAAFGGSNRYIVDYLVEEVLARQPPEVQSFLLRAAVLDRFCAPLCDVLLANEADIASSAALGILDTPAPHAVPSANGRTRPHRLTAEALLERVERANLFLVPLDDERQWYRYHHLFADVLRSRLRLLDPDLFAELYKRASDWFEEQKLMEEAVKYALAAADYERAATLIESREAATATLRSGRLETGLGWLRALPEPLVRSRPLLSVRFALLLMFTGRLDAIPAHLRAAEAVLATDVAAAPNEGNAALLGFVAVVQAHVALVAGDLDCALPYIQKALELVPPSEPGWYAGILTAAAYTFQLSGDATAAAERQAEVALAAARATGGVALLELPPIVHLAHVYLMQGRLRQAAATLQQVPQAMPPFSLEHLPGSHSYHAALGELLRERNELDASERNLKQSVEGIDAGVVVQADVIARGYFALVRLRLARGEVASALATLDAFTEMAHQRGFLPELVERTEAMRAEIALAVGDVDTAVRWADASRLSSEDAELPFRREPAYLALARVRIAQGRSGPGGSHMVEVLRLLERLQREAEAQGRERSVLEILVLRALALHARRDPRGAVQTLLQALLRAQPEGYVRLFADEGVPMASLLDELLDAAAQRRVAVAAAVLEYTQFLLTVCRSRDGGSVLRQTVLEGNGTVSRPFPASLAPPAPPVAVGVPPLLDPLTERELEVLRLLAQGASNGDIAEALVVTVGTVKKHVFNVCSKLGAGNRTQAVARARALQLL